jgi:hypothetical protein
LRGKCNPKPSHSLRLENSKKPLVLREERTAGEMEAGSNAGGGRATMYAYLDVVQVT